jgi:hypothetical protein
VEDCGEIAAQLCVIKIRLAREPIDLQESTSARRSEAERRRRAQDFIAQEEADSGIIVMRGNELRFWHIGFQEYLAARALAARDDRRQRLYTEPKLYLPEWREVVLLLAGIRRERPDRYHVQLRL